jgi:hypothetical protein
VPVSRLAKLQPNQSRETALAASSVKIMKTEAREVRAREGVTQ